MLWAANTRPAKTPASASTAGIEPPCWVANRTHSASVSARWMWNRAPSSRAAAAMEIRPGNGTV